MGTEPVRSRICAHGREQRGHELCQKLVLYPWRHRNYWEHFGMMDHESYAKSAFQKMQLYNTNKILLSDTLLATYETEDRPLKSNFVENMIQQYFL